MKRIIAAYILMLFCGTLFQVEANIGLENSTNEKVVLVTDRSLYIAGEQICFSAALISRAEKRSTVLYVEVLTVENSRVFAGKYDLVNNKAVGVIPTSHELVSGWYIIKAYTKWMRNFGLEDFSISLVQVVNPKKGVKGESVVRANNNARVTLDSVFSHKGISVIMEKKNYKPREKVQFSFNLSKSVTPIVVAAAVVPRQVGKGFHLKSNGNNENKTPEFIYPQEVNSLIVCGKVTETMGKNAPYKRVNITTLSPITDFIAGRTDSAGNFIIQLPKNKGRGELFVGTEEVDGDEYRILIDSDYDTRPIALPHTPLSYSADLALAMSQNYQIDSSYNYLQRLTLSDSITIGQLPFYGKPEYSLFLDKYIQLPTIQEYFLELIHEVDIRSKNGRKYFKIQSNNSDMLTYDPLILVDNIAIENHERVLKIKANQIEQIDLINNPYYKGEMTYGGIISFKARKGDFAGIELSPSDIFVSYEMLAASTCPELGVEERSFFPDARNTLYWNPDIDLITDSALHFYTPDLLGEYEIVIWVVDVDGNLIVNNEPFSVR